MLFMKFSFLERMLFFQAITYVNYVKYSSRIIDIHSISDISLLIAGWL